MGSNLEVTELSQFPNAYCSPFWPNSEKNLWGCGDNSFSKLHNSHKFSSPMTKILLCFFLKYTQNDIFINLLCQYGRQQPSWISKNLFNSCAICHKMTNERSISDKKGSWIDFCQQNYPYISSKWPMAAILDFNRYQQFSIYLS